jgi:hypothetical protein
MKITPAFLRTLSTTINLLRGSYDMDRMTPSGYYKPRVAIDEKALFETITPMSVIVLMENDRGDWRPLLWCPDESWAREYLEHAANMEFIEVWEVSREEPAPKHITDDFCSRWLDQHADYSDDEEGFLENLPEYVRAHYGDEAVELYRQSRAAK